MLRDSLRGFAAGVVKRQRPDTKAVRNVEPVCNHDGKTNLPSNLPLVLNAINAIGPN
jgi:hypothetical protein